MPTSVSHSVATLAFLPLLPEGDRSKKVICAGIACSIIPDIDVIGFRFGIQYGHLLGHRGITHSFLFAILVSLTMFGFVFGRDWTERWRRFRVFLFLALAAVSHPLLDALTNGGLGVALFAPFDAARYFFPWRPIEVSPLTIRRLLSEAGLRVLWSEVQWVWIPSFLVGCANYLIVRRSVPKQNPPSAQLL